MIAHVFLCRRCRLQQTNHPSNLYQRPANEKVSQQIAISCHIHHFLVTWPGWLTMTSFFNLTPRESTFKPSKKGLFRYRDLSLQSMGLGNNGWYFLMNFNWMRRFHQTSVWPWMLCAVFCLFILFKGSLLPDFACWNLGKTQPSDGNPVTYWFGKHCLGAP